MSLKALIKEVISETYFGASSNFSQLDSPAYNSAGSKSKPRPHDEEAVDEVELTEKIYNIFLSIPNIPRSGESYSDVSISEYDIAAVLRANIGGDANYPLGDYGDKAFNHAAAVAAQVLLDNPDDLAGAANMAAKALVTPDAEYDMASTRMYEGIIAFPRSIQ